MKNNLPLVPIEKFSLEESQYERGNKIWMATTLIDYCKAKEYKEFDLPLAAVDLSEMNFRCCCLSEFIWQMKRVQDTDLDYPVILDDLGQIADGYHRVCKAILEGMTTIKAIRMESMPAYDKWEEKKD